NLNADKTKATLHIDDKIYTYDVKAENGNELNVSDYVVYNDASEYLADEFQLLDLRLHREIQRSSKKISRTDKDQDIIIEKQEHIGGALPDEELFGNYISEFEKKLLFKRKISIEKGIIKSLPLVFLSTLFELDRFEELCIVVCLAPEIDTKYERLYGYLQDNISNKFATIDLIIRVLEPSLHGSMPTTSILNRYFSSNNVFQKYHIIHFIDNFSDIKQRNTQFSHMISTPLKLDNRIVEFLIGSNGFDKRLEPIAELVEPDFSIADLLPFKKEFIKKVCDLTLSHYYHNTDKTIRTSSSSALSTSSSSSSSPNQCAIIYFLAGQDESEKKIMARGICRLLNRKMFIIDLRESFLQGLDFEWVVEEVIREALFQQALVYIESFDKVIEDVKNESFYKTISNIISKYEKATIICCFLSSSSNILPVYLSKRHILVSIDFPYPDRNSSLVLWQSISKKYLVDDDINLDLISSKFNLGRSKIDEAFKLAENISILNHGKNYRISFEDLSKACRSLSSQKLGSIAKKVESQYAWNDIMLPSETIEQLEQICNHVKYKNIVYGKWGFEKKSNRGNGLNILFSGHSGTGKTMAAEIIANELKLDLYKIDLSLVISKYIGETEKNLGQVFNEAEERNAILFFDEADALFGKRSDVKDAHDRYANTEINYLLQKMEDYT
ncbi:MAG: ATP-binding protein, partial [Nitrososphaeraceae archaeon]